LTLNVTDVPIDNPPAGAPMPGDAVRGVYLGELPCQRGSYAPNPGDKVIAYLKVRAGVQPWCCTSLDCDDACEGLDSLDEQDGCRSECQSSEDGFCEEEASASGILGEF